MVEILLKKFWMGFWASFVLSYIFTLKAAPSLETTGSVQCSHTVSFPMLPSLQAGDTPSFCKRNVLTTTVQVATRFQHKTIRSGSCLSTLGWVSILSNGLLGSNVP